MQNIKKFCKWHPMDARRPFDCDCFCGKHSQGIAPHTLDAKYFHHIGDVAVFFKDGGYTRIFCNFHDYDASIFCKPVRAISTSSFSGWIKAMANNANPIPYNTPLAGTMKMLAHTNRLPAVADARLNQLPPSCGFSCLRKYRRAMYGMRAIPNWSTQP